MCLLYHFLVNPSPGEGAGGRPCPWPAARRAVGSSAGTGPPRGGFVTNLLRKRGLPGAAGARAEPGPMAPSGHAPPTASCLRADKVGSCARQEEGWEMGKKKKREKRALSSFPSLLGQSTPSCSVVPIPAAFCRCPSSCCALHRNGVKSSFPRQDANREQPAPKSVGSHSSEQGRNQTKYIKQIFIQRRSCS